MAKGGQIPFRVAAPPAGEASASRAFAKKAPRLGRSCSLRPQGFGGSSPRHRLLPSFSLHPHAYMDVRYSDSVRVTASGSTLKAYDTSCDGRGAQANWQRTGSSTVFEKTNGEGCGTVLQFTTGGTVTQIRACLVIPAQKDPCSAWTSRQY